MARLITPAPFPTASWRRNTSKTHVGQKPNRFEPVECRHDRAIVYPWLPVKKSLDALRHSLRSVHQFFADSTCPIYIVSSVPPDWLREGGRVIHVPIRPYEEALAFGVQVAQEIIWMNDDIYLLRHAGWEDFVTALTEGTLDDQEADLRAAHNTWLVLLGNACAELRQRGHKPVWRFSTHTPYLYEREKAIEILRTYHIVRKTPFETLYHNHHGTPHEECGDHKTRTLPVTTKPRFLNHSGRGATPQTQDQLKRLLSTKPPWEK